MTAEAIRDGVSKAAIIRRLVADHIGRSQSEDPVDMLVGAFHGPVGDIDDVAYGR